MQSTNGQLVKTPRASALLSGNKYFTKAPPTYQEYTANQVLNIKNVAGKPVYGDGETDDTRNINAILSSNKDCKLIYFPAGTYIVTDTIFVPSGSRIIGDSFASIISAVGDNFENEASPRAMIRVGYPGDTGVAQVSDMVLTVADILPGCQLVSLHPSPRCTYPNKKDPNEGTARSQHRRHEPGRRGILEHALPDWRGGGQPRGE